MKIKELFENEYAPALSIDLEGIKEDDMEEIAGMLRGLMCAIEGWGPLSGLTNDFIKENNPVRLSFSSVENAHYFESCVHYYFDQEILSSIRVKRRVFKRPG